MAGRRGIGDAGRTDVLPATDAVISWTKAGSSFVVWDAHAFERDHLGRHFKHGNFSSFIRQLNTYVRFHSLFPP